MVKSKLLWINICIFSITLGLALTLAPVYFFMGGIDSFEIIATLICICFCSISITAGYHRMWSHRAYDGHPILRFVFALGGAFALQNSALHWSSDHRVHHRHVDDKDLDPYSAKRGFWFSHIGWMLREHQSNRYSDYSNVPDLQRDPIVMWQHRHYLTLVLLMNVGVPVLLGWINGDIWGMLLTAGICRLVFCHHTTFFINSLAHLWGKQPYSRSNTSKDNGFIAYLTFGEGYHNYHHSFQFDYRNGIRWWQFDPTKWLIKSLSYINLTRNLKRCADARIQQAKAAMQLNCATIRINQLPDAEALKQQLQQEYESLLAKMNDFYAARKEWIDTKTNTMIKQYERSETYRQYRELKRHFQLQQKQWLLLTAQLA